MLSELSRNYCFFLLTIAKKETEQETRDGRCCFYNVWCKNKSFTSGCWNVKDNLKQNVYKTIIPRNIRLAEAPSYGKPINLYDTKSTGAESYRLLAQEVMDRDKKI